MSDQLDFLQQFVSPNTFTYLRGILKGKPSIKHFSQNIDGIIDWVNVNKDDYNIYFGVAQRIEKTNGTKENVAGTQFLWADFDGYKHKLETLEDCYNYIIRHFPLVPTMMVATNGKNSLHLYWKLSEFLSDQPEIERLNNLLGKKLKSDKVADVSRVLRVPNSINHKNGAEVTVAHLDASVVYSCAEIEAATKVPDHVCEMVGSGDIGKFNSRSEADFIVVKELVKAGCSKELVKRIYQTTKIGKKYLEHENPDHYLELTFSNAAESAATVASVVSEPENRWGIIENNNCLYRVTGDGILVQISTFIIIPELILEGDLSKNEVDILICKIKAGHSTWNNVPIRKSGFNNAESLQKELPKVQWQFLGKNSDVQKLLPYLLEKLVKSKGTMPTKQGVSEIGRHGEFFITDTQILATSGEIDIETSEVTYLPTGRLHPKLRFETYSYDYVQSQLRLFGQLYFDTHLPTTTYGVLGWTMACYYKPFLEDTGERFPVLNLFGTRGSGKTTFTKLVQTLTGYKKHEIYNCDTTPFVLLSLLGSTNCIPVSLSEYRESHLKTKGNHVTRYILLSYDNGKDSRGRADQTTVEYRLSAPFTIDGEDGITDPACMERTIKLYMSPELVREGTPYFRTFKDMQKVVDLPAIATAMLHWSLTNNPHFDIAYESLVETIKISLPDRVRKNMAVVYMGVRSFSEMAAFYGIEMPEPNLDEVFLPMLSEIVNLNTGRTNLLVDNFIEDVVNHINTSSFNEEFIYTYIGDTSTIYFNLTGAYNWWAASKNRRNQQILQLSAIKNQLGERVVQGDELPEQGDYVTFRGSKTIGGGTVHCYGISLHLAKRAGLDVPDRIMNAANSTMRLKIQENNTHE